MASAEWQLCPELGRTKAVTWALLHLGQILIENPTILDYG